MTEHAHHPEPEIQSPQQPKSFLTFLAEQQSGVVVNELSGELRNLIEAIETHFDKFRGKGASGTLQLSIKVGIEPKLGAYTVECEYAVRMPKVPATTTIMWLGNDGNLNTSNPKQLNLPFTPVSA